MLSTSASPVSDMPHELRTRAFAEALLDSDIEIPDGVGKHGAPAPKRFSVYRNNVVVSLMEAMASAYPSVLAIVGKENFDKVARVYISRFPPQSAMMQNFGDRFADFLAGFAPLRKSAFLADVARAERAWLEAWHARDEAPLQPEELAAIAQDEVMDIVLQPLAASHIIVSTYPLADLFDARANWPVPGIDLEEAQSLLITRPQYECIVTPLQETQTGFFKALFDGSSLGEAIALAIDKDQNFDPATSISILLQSGAFQTLQSN